MMKDFNHIGVIGAGAYGTALALAARRAGRSVTLWGRDADILDEISQSRTNQRYLGDVQWPEVLTTCKALEGLVGCDAVLLVTPTQSTRSMAAAIAPVLGAGTPVVLAAKGLETGSQKRVSDVFLEEAPDLVPAVLSGPSFASDVASGLPTAVTIAADDLSLASSLCEALKGPALRPYASDDLVGVQLGGALKNVMAIAAGMVDGRALGASAKAALVTRGFAELSRLAVANGAKAETLGGLSGLGDLILTCSTPQSRNYTYGYALGQGQPPQELARPGSKLVEGAVTASVAAALARDCGVDAPITAAVAAIIEGGLDLETAIRNLMTRPLMTEIRPD
ncbi:NAD(P)H-dependent glycerol-3-phosphate dehydrogenase [Coralliovum pocilloporae]|uniref:NAD(P)H-dependent glycerol-3-phosphate dehydrogenase n=1 Tax=Coralliovum pocilloporae TaxID=3066369 RepID=UPI003D9C3384